MSISTILFIIVAILIVYMLYKKYQGGSDVAPAPNRSSTGGPRIEIDETVLELNPDSSNKEEGYMTEQYTEFLTGEESSALSGNIVLHLGWSTREGFGTVKELRFYRYLDSEPPTSKTYANRKQDTTSLKPTKLVAFYNNDDGAETAVDTSKIKYRDNYAYILKSDDPNMFTSFKQGYKIKFGNKDKDGNNAYSVVGRTHIRIEYVLDDVNNNTTGHLVPETFEGTDVTVEDLDLTLSMTETETRSIKPVYEGTQVTSDVVKELFYVIPGPFETTDDGKIKIGGRRDLGNIGTSELYPETGILRQWGANTPPFGTFNDLVSSFTNHFDPSDTPDTFLDGFINDEDFKKRVHAQRSVMFRAAGGTEEFNIVVYKTKFEPYGELMTNYNWKKAEDKIIDAEKYNGAQGFTGKLLNDGHHEFPDDAKTSKKLHESYNDANDNYSGRIGLRRFHHNTSKTTSSASTQDNNKPLFKGLEDHWEPANNDGGEFYVQIDDTSPMGWKLIKERTSASKFRLFKKDPKQWKKSDDTTMNLNVYNIQLVESGVTGEDRRFLVTTKHTDKFTDESSSKHNDNKIIAKKIDSNMTQPEYESIDWVFINVKDVKIGYKEKDGQGHRQNNVYTTVGMIVDEDKDDDNKALNDFNYDF